MPASVVGICNGALVDLGANPIVTLYPAAGENATTEQKACQAHYEPSRNFVLEDGNWSFAMARRVLVQSAEGLEWGTGNKFMKPPRFIRAVRVSSTAQDNNDLDYTIEGDFFIANASSIYLTYIQEIEDPAKFSPGFVSALIAYLSAMMAIPITSSRTIRNENLDIYEKKLNKARANDGLQGRPQEIRTSRLRAARHRGGTPRMPTDWSSA